MKPAQPLFACFAVLLCLPAFAQLRTIPADAYRADMIVGADRQVKLDDTVYRLAVSAQIYSTHNMLVQPQALVGAKYPVRLQFDDSQQVRRVWLLTQTEADAPNQPKLKSSASFWRFF